MRTKYKFVVLLSIAAVTWGSAYTMANFNEIVAPDVPVQAIHFEKAESGAYRLNILGEDLVIKIPDKYYHLNEYYHFIENKCGETLILVNNSAAGFRDKYLPDLLSRILNIEK